MVHGSEEFHSAVKKAVASCHEGAAPEAAKEKSGSWTWTVTGCDFRDREGAVVVTKLLEGVIRAGWEVLSSAEFTTTPGFELVTWVFKRSGAPVAAEGGDVAAVLFSPPNGMEVVGVTEDNKLDDVLQEALGKFLLPREEGDRAPAKPATPAEKKPDPKPDPDPEEKKEDGEEGEKVLTDY